MCVVNVSEEEGEGEMSALLELVRHGEEVLVALAGKPVARLTGFRSASGERQPGAMAGEIWIAPDFDSLPDDVAEMMGASLGASRSG